MSNTPFTPPEEQENWSKQIQKLKEKFSTLTHDEKHNEESEKDDKLKQLDIKSEDTNK